MELQTWLNENDYISEFKRNKVSFRKYPEKQLMIVKRKYGSSYNEDKEWLNYCRGLVINYQTNKVILIPPVKAIEVRQVEELPMSPVNLVDGTMVNLFYHNNEWLTSTRSTIGCTSKWSNSMDFMEMFNDCSSNLEYEKLNNEYTYSFVLRHKKNRITTPVHTNCLILVEIYHKLTRLNTLPKNKGYICVDDWIPDKLIKGLTGYFNNQRYKWLSPEHKFIEMIKPNTNNPCLNYLMLRKSGHLTSYLQLFPESRFEFDDYRKKLHQLTKIIYNYYINVFIKKTIDKQDIPYSLNPVLYEIHGIYLKTKQGISWSNVKQYMYELEPKRIQFILNKL